MWANDDDDAREVQRLTSEWTVDSGGRLDCLFIIARRPVHRWMDASVFAVELRSVNYCQLTRLRGHAQVGSLGWNYGWNGVKREKGSNMEMRCA